MLKLGHHGSGFSTSSAWLRAIRPRVAVACCGVENRFGHPSPRTVAKCEAAGIAVYRTDRDGAVSLTLEPAAIRVRCELTGAQVRTLLAN